MAQTYYARIEVPRAGSTPNNPIYGFNFVVTVHADSPYQATDIIKSMYSGCRIYTSPTTSASI